MIHGGGECETNKDWGNFGPDFDNPEQTGGKCEGGICVCFEGYTCPHCTTPGNPEDVVSGALQCDGVLGSHVSLLLVILAIVVMELICTVCNKQDKSGSFEQYPSLAETQQ